MRKIIKLLILLVSTTVFGQEYYPESVESLYGAELRVALHSLIDDHTVYSYSQCKTILKQSDQDPNNSNNLILVYREQSINKDDFAYDSNNSDMFDYWNREHVWPKSLGSFGPGGVYEDSPANTDVHHLKPCDMTMNADRGNKGFDNGGVAHLENMEVKYTDISWEAPDNVKGDIARMLFYMDVRYEGGEGEPNLELVEWLDTYPNPEIGKLSTLLEWHNADPVDVFEMNRNDVIYSWQNNRNPFIDYPEFVDRIWGADSTLESSTIPNIFISEYIEGSAYNKAIELYNASTSEVDLTNIELWQIFNGGEWSETSLGLAGVISPGETYVICHPNADSILLMNSDVQLEILFNGNDAVGLSYLGELIDQVGESGLAPSDAWDVASVVGATKNHGLRRKSYIQSGIVNWSLSAGEGAEDSQWIVLDQDDFSGIGSHSFSQSQQIQLPQGWYMLGCRVDISSYVLQDVFAPINDLLIIVKNGEGDVYIPEWDFDNIGVVEPGEGLIIKTSQNTNLMVNGGLVDLSQHPLYLPQGWSCKSYMLDQAINVEDVIGNLDEIVIVKDYIGQAYLPNYNFNGIGDFKPDQSYMFKSNAEITIDW